MKARQKTILTRFTLAALAVVTDMLSDALLAKGGRACVKPRCRAKKSSLIVVAGFPVVSELKLKNKVDVIGLPVQATYLWNWAAGKSSVISFGPELWYSGVAYEIEAVQKTGTSYAGGFTLAFSSMGRAKSVIHQVRYSLSVIPFTQFSVKSTGTSDITVQEEVKSATTQTILTYRGAGAGLNVGMTRFWRKIQYGLLFGVHYHSFQTRSEQSLQKIQGEDAVLRSPVSSSVKYSLVTGFAGFLLGVDF